MKSSEKAREAPKEKKRKEEKERARRRKGGEERKKKTMVALLVSIMASFGAFGPKKLLDASGPFGSATSLRAGVRKGREREF